MIQQVGGRPSVEHRYEREQAARGCQHGTWTFSGGGQRTYLKCTACPAVMPICHECGQSVMPETSEEGW